MQQRRRRQHIKNLTLACLLTASVALAQEKISFDIPEQDASTAIQSWARQSGLQVFAADEHLRGIRTHAVHGEYSPRAAFARTPCTESTPRCKPCRS